MKQFFFLFTILFSCSASYAQQKWITLGAGGGFAGTVNMYKITEDGVVLKGQGLGEIKFTEQGKLKQTKIRKCIKAVADQTSAISQFKHPGNMYYFLSYHDGDIERNITWGDLSHPVPEAIQDIYENLVAQLKSVDFKAIQ